jgi:hypothetical protein
VRGAEVRVEVAPGELIAGERHVHDAVHVGGCEAGVGEGALGRLRGDLRRRATRGARVIGVADADDRDGVGDVVELLANPQSENGRTTLC